jgi:hypothetical protein
MTILYLSRNEWKYIQDTAERVWHFEQSKNSINGVAGVKPVKGKYNPGNPNHIKISDVISINEHLRGERYKWT